MTTKELAQRVHKHFGRATQLRKLQEECGELVAAINQYMEGREGALDAMVGEMGDVFFLLMQHRLDLGCRKMDNAIDYKANRTWQRIQDGYYDAV